MYSNILHRKLPLFTFLFAILLTGCASSYDIYIPAENSQPPRSGRIAVIGGFNTDYTNAVTDKMTSFITQLEGFTVVTQAEITKVFPSYPANILDSQGFTENDLNKMDRIQKGLGADYLLVIWLGNFSSSSSSQTIGRSYHVDVFARMISYPEGAVIGTSAFGFKGGRAFQTEEEALEEMWSEIVRTLGEEIFMDEAGKL